jgi:hypothetical protein
MIQLPGRSLSSASLSFLYEDPPETPWIDSFAATSKPGKFFENARKTEQPFAYVSVFITLSVRNRTPSDDADSELSGLGIFLGNPCGTGLVSLFADSHAIDEVVS